MDIFDKKVLIVGLGKSGEAAVKLLIDKGAQVWATEKNKNDKLKAVSSELIRLGANVELGRHSYEFLEGKDLVVLSPGVQPGCEIIKWANECNIPVVSELEAASWYVHYPIICVTGTNGKSTVTSLIGHILRYNKINAVVCGNIGIPLSRVLLQKEKYSIAVVEASSFQLEYISEFHPETAVWLNFSCDHLDHHLSMDAYFNAKLNIFKNQGIGNWAVIHYKEIDRVRDYINAKIVTYSDLNTNYNSFPSIYPADIEAAFAAASIYGISPKDISSAIESFEPLPHRLQYVTAVDGIKFIDDSKATNADSVIGALNLIEGRIILILGGRDKGDDFGILRDVVLKKADSIIIIGEAQEKICRQLEGTVPIKRGLGLEDAVRYAFLIAKQGQTVLLSPGCASFDMYKDYAERGRVFQECVFSITGNGNLKSVMETTECTEFY